jgi:hypothetical protein
MNCIYELFEAIGLGFLVAICCFLYFLFQMLWNSGDSDEMLHLQEKRKTSPDDKTTCGNNIQRK